MDGLLPHLLAFPPHPPPLQPLSNHEYDTQIKGLLKILNKTPASHLMGVVPGGGDLLDILNPSINTMAFLHALLANLSFSSEKKLPAPGGSLWFKMVNFLEQFDPIQVRYSGAEFKRLIEKVTACAKAASQPELAIPPIRTAILRLDPSSSTLTSTHVLFVRLCLEARNYRAALPILNRDIYHFPRSGRDLNPAANDGSLQTFITYDTQLSARLRYQSILEYYYYGAMVYIGLQLWDKALQFLQTILTTPSNGNVTSAIMMEAYKKWILVGLLVNGKPRTAPKGIHGGTGKSLEALASPYKAVAEIFPLGDYHRLEAECDVGKNIWREDHNTGLITAVLSAHRKFSVFRLQSTYISLSMHEIALLTSPITPDESETETYIQFLIRNGDLNATISSPSSNSKIVHFNTSNQKTEAELSTAMTNIANSIFDLQKQIQGTDLRITLSKEYVDHLRKQKQNKEAAAARAPGPVGEVNMRGELIDMNMNDDFGIDEDMMADL